MAAPEHASYRSKRFFLHLPGRPHMAVGNGRSAAFSLGRPAAQARHLGGRRGLVDEDQPLRIEIELLLEPHLAGRLHVAALLLGGMRRLFLNVMRRRSKKRHSVPMPTMRPRLFSFSRSSASVMSGVSET